MYKSFTSIYLGAFLLLITLGSKAQSTIESQALRSAKSMNISTQQQALDELKNRGISENQARQMARMRGVDFDQFLRSNFNNSIDTSIKIPVDNKIIDTGLRINTTSYQTSNTQEYKQTNKLDSNFIKYFGYDVFLNNPFAQKEYLVGNIDEGYIIAPGDVVKVLVFGDNATVIMRCS
jgi:polysaccharide export outer membrane protein